MTLTLRPKLFCLLTISLLAGCNHMATGSVQAENTATKTTKTTSPSTAETPAQATQKTNLTGESLFQLLLAEIAVNRRDYGTAAVLYGEVGSKYNSVEALARAAALNQTIGRYDDMYQESEKWLALRPDSEQAKQAVILSAAATGNIDQSLSVLAEWLAQNPKADASILAPSIKLLPEESISQLSHALADLQTSYPKSPSLYYTRGRLAYAAGKKDEAAELTKRSMNLNKNLAASLFYYQLMLESKQTKAAKQVIERLVKDHPNNVQVAVQYTRYLHTFEPENLKALEVLHNRFGRDPVIARTYARAAFDQQAFDAAQAVYRHLLEQGYSDEAHYFLGRIDAINEQPSLAADHFEAVNQPPYLTSALAEWINLGRSEDESRIVQKLTRSRADFPASTTDLWRLQASYYHVLNRPKQSWDTLETAIAENPENIELLYDQAMLAAELDRHARMEQNLQEILVIEPDNINAMNALGYTWIDMDKNLEQASKYVETALAAEPDNPAFQDSKGWYLYRIGQFDEALAWLNRAYAQLENDEVAAHIAEVLWTMGRKDEARNYLNEVKRLNPNSKYLDHLNELFSR